MGRANKNGLGVRGQFVFALVLAVLVAIGWRGERALARVMEEVQSAPALRVSTISDDDDDRDDDDRDDDDRDDDDRDDDDRDDDDRDDDDRDDDDRDDDDRDDDDRDDDDRDDDDRDDDDRDDDDRDDDDRDDDDRDDDDRDDDDRDDDDRDDDDRDDDDRDDDDRDDDGRDDDDRDDDDRDDSRDDDDDEIERYGRLLARPDGSLVGRWVVDGVTYTATERTRFETRFGGFEVGVCVKVESPIAEPTFAKKLRTERDYKCNGWSDDDDDAEGELYGTVRQLPEGGGPGLWIIGGKPITATEHTRFISNGGVFTVGVTVKVEFVTDRLDRSFAKYIELKFRSHDDDDDDDDDRPDFGARPGREGHVFGVIDSRPAGGITGIWVIGGIEYTVDAWTRLKDVERLVAGARVKVLYQVNAAGQRRAVKIDVTNNRGGTKQDDAFKVVGYVEGMPVQGFIGQWQIAGVGFIADGKTRFEEDDGLFAVGSYVEVEYVISGGVRRILEIETNVPPGAGMTQRVGKIERKDDDDGMQVAQAQAATWTVGGMNYVVTPATQLDDTRAEMAVGSTVAVNSYVNGAGEHVATSIRAVTLQPKSYLPQLRR